MRWHMEIHIVFSRNGACDAELKIFTTRKTFVKKVRLLL